MNLIKLHSREGDGETRDISLPISNLAFWRMEYPSVPEKYKNAPHALPYTAVYLKHVAKSYLKIGNPILVKNSVEEIDILVQCVVQLNGKV